MKIIGAKFSFPEKVVFQYFYKFKRGLIVESAVYSKYKFYTFEGELGEDGSNDIFNLLKLVLKNENHFSLAIVYYSEDVQ